MTTTIRENVMAYLTTMFRNVVAGQPTPDPYTVQWTRVENAEFEYSASKKNYALVIQDVTEKKQAEIGVYVNTMRVCMEFYAYTETNSDRMGTARLILGEIERLVFSDQQLGGNAMGVYEVSNELKVDSPDVHEIQGVVYWDVQYRHSISDPRKTA